jgi:pyridoxine 4-dehydrogenase
MPDPVVAHRNSKFAIGGDLPVDRLGYGTMRLAGPGVWGEPRDRDEAVRVLRRAVELGVTLIDTADSYGPFVTEALIREALHPYPDGVVIATKAGFVRTGFNQWHAVGRPEYLRQEAEMSLRRLGLDRIDLYQLHGVDPQVPLEEQIGVFADLQHEGKVRHIGLCNVSVEEVTRARAMAPIATVQNRYSLADRTSESVVDYCETEGLAFIPWYPIASGKLARGTGSPDAVSRESGATLVQLALAWLLHRSPAMLPIPGTSKVAHLEENMGAAEVRLTDEQFAALGTGAWA